MQGVSLWNCKKVNETELPANLIAGGLTTHTSGCYPITKERKHENNDIIHNDMCHIAKRGICPRKWN